MMISIIKGRDLVVHLSPEKAAARDLEMMGEMCIFRHVERNERAL